MNADEDEHRALAANDGVAEPEGSGQCPSASPTVRERLDAIASILKVEAATFTDADRYPTRELKLDLERIAAFAQSRDGETLLALFSDVEDDEVRRLVIELVLAIGSRLRPLN